MCLRVLTFSTRLNFFLCFFALLRDFFDENFLQNSCLFLLSFDEHVLHSFQGRNGFSVARENDVVRYVAAASSISQQKHYERKYDDENDENE